MCAARRLAVRIGCLLVLVGCVRVGEPSFFRMCRQTCKEGTLRCYFFKLLGDSCLIELPSGKFILVDGAMRARLPGFRSRLTRRLNALGVDGTNLSAVFLTHPHFDHYGGLEAVFKEFRPDVYYHTGVHGLGGRYQHFLDLLDRFVYRKVRVRRGTPAIDLGDGVRCEFLWPKADCRGVYFGNAANVNSLVIRLTYGNVSFLFTGDMKEESEHDLLRLDPKALRADVLKVAHHGSKTSSCREFLDAVRPKVAIITGGRLNIERAAIARPSSETIARLQQRGSSVARTDLMGTVFLETDGKAIISFGAPANRYLLDDSDSDGLTDGCEMFVYGTDRWTADTDGDGANDYEEAASTRRRPNRPDSAPHHHTAGPGPGTSVRQSYREAN